MKKGQQKRTNCEKNLVIEQNLYDAQNKTLSKVSPNDSIERTKIDGTTAIMGGHYWINTESPYQVGKNAQETWRFACENVSKLIKQGYEAHVSLMMNDMYINSKERAQIRENFEIPKSLVEILHNYDLSDENIIKCGGNPESPNFGKIHWEKPLVNRFNGIKSGFGNRFPEASSKLETACPKGVAEYALDLHNQGIDNLILTVPGCSIDSIIAACPLIKEALPELNLYALFHTGNCYE